VFRAKKKVWRRLLPSFCLLSKLSPGIGLCFGLR
jgi:hypothetical protein